MPDMLGKLGQEESARAVAELSAFLRSETNVGPKPKDMGEAADAGAAAERGERIFHDVGCVMCHGPRVASAGSTRVPDAPAGARSLDHVANKYTTRGLAAFLLEPLQHRPAGLMPEMHLDRGEAADLAAYLAPSNAGTNAPKANDALVSAGRTRFRELRCASCHAGVDTEMPVPSGAALENPSAGCLADSPPASVPHYALTLEERGALRLALGELKDPLSPEDEVTRSLSAFGCASCHSRGDIGGVPRELDGYLTTDQPDLGDEARRPPHLTGVGGKLRLSWLESVLYDGASVRPYMHTRMPIFGASNVAHLPALLERVDAQPDLELPKATGEDEGLARDAAQKMLGVTGLACVTCHTFNGKPAPSFQGLDLITTPERLRERWFRDFLVAPQSKLPGVVMPEAWPGGKAVLDDVLDGNTDRQIAALWHYLKLGTSARDPRGIYQPQWNVDVAESPRVYRGRSRVAGFRGIAVGFPTRLHFAFDANNGALAALWRGDFVSVNWNGQGAGDFNPRSRAVELPRDVSWLQRPDDGSTWPLRPITTKEAPINPDPGYPRQHGYRFRGYQLDADGVPTLRYWLHNVAIEDRLVPESRGGRTVLRRVISLETDVPTQVTFRALAGELETLEDGRRACAGIALSTGDAKVRTRAAGDGEELLIDLDLRAGRTELELTYDLLD